ncbi:hypothetical protein [Pantoea vagans]|uniref:hypothetical protein n=1 Tax=Pantoea vagans TaxID=470934 RepID=UPI003209F0F9
MDYQLSYKDAAAYTDAMEYLLKHFNEFPASVPSGGPIPEISVTYFKSHRFVLTPEGEVVFGDCMVPGINKSDFDNYRREVYEPEMAFDLHPGKDGKKKNSGGTQ